MKRRTSIAVFFLLSVMEVSLGQEGGRAISPADAYFDEQQYEQAAILYEQVLGEKSYELSAEAQATASIRQGETYVALGRHGDAVQAFQQALGRSRNHQLHGREGAALNALAAVCQMQGNYMKALQVETEYLAWTRESESRRLDEAFSWQRRARIYKAMCEPEASWESYEESLHILEQLHARPQQGALLAEMIQYRLEREDYGAETIRCLKKAAEVSESQGDLLGSGFYHNALARLFLEAGRHAEARLYIELMEKNPAVDSMVWLKSAYLAKLLRLEKKAKRHKRMQKIQQEQEAAFEATRTRPKSIRREWAAKVTYSVGLHPIKQYTLPVDEAGQGPGWLKLALFHRYAGQLDEAAALVRNKLEQEPATVEKRIYRISVGILGQLYKEAGRSSEALDTFQRFVSLEVAVNAELQQFFQRINDRIVIRGLEQEKGVYALELRQRRRERLFLITVGILLALLAAVLYWLYRNRIKSNRLLARKNETIFRALSEKELLLREVHHRVKNNLQTISSLLGVQSRFIDDPEALLALNKGRNRVESMALIHQNLYRQEDIKSISVQDYVEQLCTTLFNSYNIDPQRIRLHTDVDALLLDVDRMIPLGLILNELITNALKHAFPDGRAGDVAVSLKEQDGGLLLEVRDNGVGLPPDKQLDNSPTFGFRLVRSFARKLGAQLEVDNGVGTAVRMWAPADR